MTPETKIQLATDLVMGRVALGPRVNALCDAAGLKCSALKMRLSPERGGSLRIDEAESILYALKNGLFDYSGARELNVKLGYALDEAAELRGEPTE